LPSGTPEQVGWFIDFARVSHSAENSETKAVSFCIEFEVQLRLGAGLSLRAKAWWGTVATPQPLRQHASTVCWKQENRED
jgi:hypothetical protein